MAQSWQRMERRVQKLEEAAGIGKVSSLELSTAVRELHDMKQAFYAQMESRPIIREGLQKYQMIMKAADEQEGTSNWTSAIKAELLLQEIPRLRLFSSIMETFHQLEPIIDVASESQYGTLVGTLDGMRCELEGMLRRLNEIQSYRRQYVEAEALAITLAEEKILEIDERCPQLSKT